MPVLFAALTKKLARQRILQCCVSLLTYLGPTRFCVAEGLENVETLSAYSDPFRDPSFGNDYGVRITTGPLKGLLSCAVIVLDDAGKILYTEQVPEITQEPNYEAALAVLK